ncbi:hypothetical protein ACLKA7_016640 [Drosophila subpalustris]
MIRFDSIRSSRTLSGVSNNATISSTSLWHANAQMEQPTTRHHHHHQHWNMAHSSGDSLRNIATPVNAGNMLLPLHLVSGSNT